MLTITKEVPVAGRHDTVVCGGGPAGWVAAAAAARCGCRTALIERFGFLGGAAARAAPTVKNLLWQSGGCCGIVGKPHPRKAAQGQTELPR